MDKRRTLQGTVTKTSGANTVRVRVETKWAHPLYRRTVRRHKNYLAHISNVTSVNPGDVVTIEECKPISGNKTWQVKEVNNDTNTK